MKLTFFSEFYIFLSGCYAFLGGVSYQLHLGGGALLLAVVGVVGCLLLSFVFKKDECKNCNYISHFKKCRRRF